jgi:hypothetical protein
MFGSPGCKARRFAIVVPDSPIFIYIAFVVTAGQRINEFADD